MAHAEEPDLRHWHVVVTVCGTRTALPEVRRALDRLADERPFLLEGRYSETGAEVSYWEQAETLEDAAALALRVWGEHRGSAGLPAWEVCGLEVLESSVHERRADAAAEGPGVRGRRRRGPGRVIHLDRIGWQPFPG